MTDRTIIEPIIAAIEAADTEELENLSRVLDCLHNAARAQVYGGCSKDPALYRSVIKRQFAHARARCTP